VKQIYLLRHADSDWSNLNQHDFYRSLSKKGIQEASKLSNFFKNQTISVDKVFCSSSERTKQTFDMCSDGLGYPITNATYLDRLYLAGAHEIISLIKELRESTSSILIIGHNPAMLDLVNIFSNSKINNYPSCSLSEIIVESLWKDLSLKKCKLKSVCKPQEF
jgi:phosphohistidine phosphatase